MKALCKTLCLLAVAAFALCAVPACNTIEGVGEDTAAVGEGLSGAARDANPDNDE